MKLFELYKEAKVEKNKSEVLDSQLNVMIAIGKIKDMLGIKKEGDK